MEHFGSALPGRLARRAGRRVGAWVEHWLYGPANLLSLTVVESVIKGLVEDVWAHHDSVR